MNELIYFCAVVLPWILVIGLISYFFITPKKIAAIRLLGLSFLGAIIAWFVASLFKYNFPSPRPFEILANIKPLFATARGDAFPSGHATFFGALATGLFLQNKKIGAAFIVGALLIAHARVLAGVHWPIDVVAGLILGAICSVAVIAVFRKLYPR